ncbi:hypothetical protein HPB49_017361 [Dermacentor silvarum]|uniref:Uncharacterized protein n=1 Tax=Dermacentor silvarum TaxID=543639 RepID=A0ACB8C4K6_DERSI|nr:hypothetical protein HPB49_017361 [Dermacentor silvarum]
MGSGSRTFDERFPCFLTTGNSINRRNSESGIDRDQFLQDPFWTTGTAALSLIRASPPSTRARVRSHANFHAYSAQMETDGTRSPDTMDADASSGQDEGDTNWFLVARKKKRLAQAAADQPPPPAPQVPRKTNARLPPLPIDDYKIVSRPREGLNLGAWPQTSVARAIGIAAGLDSAVLNELIIRIRTDQNLAVLSTPDENLAARLQRVQFLSMGLTQHAKLLSYTLA